MGVCGSTWRSERGAGMGIAAPSGSRMEEKGGKQCPVCGRRRYARLAVS